MTIHFRIRYKVLEEGHTYAGDKVGPESMGLVLEQMRRRYPDFNIIHAELIEAFEYEEPKVFSLSGESLIVLGLNI